MNVTLAQTLLEQFKLKDLFIQALSWQQPTITRPIAVEAQGVVYNARMLAQLAGAAVFAITRDQGPAGIPEQAARDAVEREIAKQFRENLCIFLDHERKTTQTFWVWAKRARDEEGRPKRWLREHSYFVGQPVDLFMPKLRAMFFELAEVVDGANLTVVKVAQRMQEALDVEKVTKKFFKDYQAEHLAFLQHIDGLADDRERRWYASVLLNRLMFVWFLQKKGFLNHPPGGTGDYDYLDKKLADSMRRGKDRFYQEFLQALFFEAFAKPETSRSADAKALCGDIPYLNGGLFLEHPLELDADKALRMGKTLKVPDVAFDNLFALFRKYEWSLDDTPGGKADEINPDVLGYIFERYINVVSTHSQKDLGAYYTRPEITGYLAERAIESAVLQRINAPALPELGLGAIDFASVPEMLARMDDDTALKLLQYVLPGLKILDPAVGSGAFLVAAMKVLINIYSAIVGRAALAGSPGLRTWLEREKAEHHNIGYAIRRRIITHNLYGVDLLEGAAEIAKLRLFLALVASAKTVDDLEPLPNIDFNLLRGNSLIGLMRVDEHEFFGKQHGLFATPFSKLLEEKNRRLNSYKNSSSLIGKVSDLRVLRDEIDAKLLETNATLNDLLVDDFNGMNVKFEQATWDIKKQALGKPVKRAISRSDIDALTPFHWGFVFDDIMQPRSGGAGRNSGGFDIILANPPWDVFQTDEKEFFADYDAAIKKNSLRIEDWKAQFKKFMQKSQIRADWLEYCSRFPHVAKYFKTAPEYAACHDTGKLNLYMLFLQRCLYLLREGGHCGIVIPSGIYTDLGAKGLRELLFDRTRIEGLFGFENRKKIFDGVDSRFKFVVLTFEKVSSRRVQQSGERNASAAPDDLFSPAREPGTKSFPAAFMRHDVEELGRFPAEGAIEIPVSLVKKLSPNALSIMEFQGPMDVRIVERMLKFPLLGQRLPESWNLVLATEFNMTTDSHLYEVTPGKGRLPLWEGKQFHQFDANFGRPRYWLDEQKSRAELMAPLLRFITHEFERLGLDQLPDPNKVCMNYESFRLAFRDVGRNTDERTVIACILPPKRFCPHTVSLEQVYFDAVSEMGHESGTHLTQQQRLYLCAIFNSFVFDWTLRKSVTAHLSFFFIYNTPVPRLDPHQPTFRSLVRRAGRLTCTTIEFDAMAREVGLRSHEDGTTNESERAQLRAEIDGLVAHLYGLTEEEFIHILSTFPLVKEPVKVAARNAYRDVAKGLLEN